MRAPSGNTISCIFQVDPKGLLPVGAQAWLLALIKLPTFTDGFIQITAQKSGVSVGSLATWDETHSGETIHVAIPMNVEDADENFSFAITTLAVTGLSGTLDIGRLAIVAGYAAPKWQYLRHKKNVITYRPAAPTAGAWKQGDVVYNSAPTAAGSACWICVADGTPRTWKTFGAIAA